MAVAVYPFKLTVAVTVIIMGMRVADDHFLIADQMVDQSLQIANAERRVDEQRLFRTVDQIHPDVARSVKAVIVEGVHMIAHLINLVYGLMSG